MEQLAGPVVLPSHYLREAVAGFQESLQQYRACAAELEQVLGQQQQLLEAGATTLGWRAGGEGQRVWWESPRACAWFTVHSRDALPVQQSRANA